MKHFSIKTLIFCVGLLSINSSDAETVQCKSGSYTTSKQKKVYFGSSYVGKIVQNILIAWDLNGVIFTKKFGAAQFIKAAFRKHGIVAGAFGLKGLLAIKKEMNKKRKKEGKPVLSWEHLMYHLLRSGDPIYEAHARFLQSCIEGPDKVHAGVAALLEELDVCGHKQAVLSNMWESNLMIQMDMVHEKIAAIKKEAATYDDQWYRDFQNGDTVHDAIQESAKLCFTKAARLQVLLDMLANIKTRVIPTQENNWVHKTEAQIYQLFLLTNKADDGTLTVFIDDNRENVVAAVEHGGFDIGIVFTTSKELRKTFEHLEILPNAQIAILKPQSL